MLICAIQFRLALGNKMFLKNTFLIFFFFNFSKTHKRSLLTEKQERSQGYQARAEKVMTLKAIKVNLYRQKERDVVIILRPSWA